MPQFNQNSNIKLTLGVKTNIFWLKVVNTSTIGLTIRFSDILQKISNNIQNYLMFFKQKCSYESYTIADTKTSTSTQQCRIFFQSIIQYDVYIFYGFFSWTSLTKVFLLNPRHDFISYCFLPSRPATLQWLGPACLCVEFCKPKCIRWVMPVLVLACHKNCCPSWVLEVNPLRSSPPPCTFQFWRTTAEMTQEPAPENHSNQLKVYTSQWNTRLPSPQLTGYPGGQAGANPVVRKGEGEQTKKRCWEIFRGDKMGGFWSKGL